MRGLLLSAYAADSHKRWRRGLLRELPDVDWTVLELPPRFFSWRFRGNALTWALNERETLEQHYDFLLATSMTDLATLKGLIPNLQKIPTIVYFHENQFVYPIQHKVVQREVFHFCMLNIYTALSADVILFNSEYNRTSMLNGVRKLIQTMPDFAPKETTSIIEERSIVLPVPLEDSLFHSATTSSSSLSILWNHRWEYDKAPERFFAAMYALKDLNVDFTLHIVGQQFRSSPAIFATAKEHLAAHIQTWGYQKSKEDYLSCLQNANVIVSSALHEFQGLALLEAVACGCYPLAPNRLAYSEFLPESCLYESHPDDRQKEMISLLSKLQTISKHFPSVLPDVSHLQWSTLAARYRTVITQVTS